MSSKKTIQINPELFKLPGSKTKKNREKKELVLAPVVSPNNLKNKLLKRIKEHKTNELKKDSNKPDSEKITQEFSDEFHSAVNYLSDLSNKQKRNIEKEKYKRNLQNKTLKNTSNTFVSSNQQFVSLDLPPELEESFNNDSKEVFNINYKPDQDVPYGCLKNGIKPSYRTWIKTKKNYDDFSSSLPDLDNLIRPPTPPKKHPAENISLNGVSAILEPNITSQNKSNRGERLELIKNKLKQIQDQENADKMKKMEEINAVAAGMGINSSFDVLGTMPKIDLGDIENDNSNDIDELFKTRSIDNESKNTKQFLKKTTKRKFTLGKSDALRKVAVLIKDKQTRKNIINTQKTLKKTHINDIRKYLRQHGIIKVGTTCPADILRKTFESAMLAGEITNTNKETLLHNFLNDETKL